MKSCLVIEDVPEIRRWLCGLLQDIFQPEALLRAGTLSESYRLIETHQPELILVDLSLPDGDGTELIRRVKRHSPSTLCVVATIFDNATYLFPALRAGADGYLLKSDLEEHLISALQGIVDGKPPLSASVALSILEHFQAPAELEADLTTREEELLILIANGYSVPRSAECMGISANTAAGYLKTVYQKLQVTNRA